MTEQLTTVSASKLKTFKTCHRKYYYTYILPYSDRPENHKNVAGLLGTSLHKVIEAYYRDRSINPTLLFQDLMLQTLEEWETQQHTIVAQDYFPRAMKVGKEILRAFDWNLYNPAHLEYEFTLPFPDATHPICNINGLIDAIDVTEDGRLRIIDYKSASALPAQDEIDNDAQFILYYWAQKQLTGNVPDQVIWHHLRTAKQVVVDVATNYDDKLIQLTNDIYALLSTNHWPRINLSDTCKKRCSFYDMCFGTKIALADIEIESED